MANMLMESRTRSTDERFYGVVVGTVLDNLDPLEQGRVKVKLQDFDIESEWCLVSNFYAGNGYGSFFVPEVGDQVLVAFIHGDMRHPIILGGLYNDKDKPPTARTDDKDQKMIRTKGQHEILLDDTPGEERVQLKTKGGHVVDLSDVDKKITVKSTGENQLVLDDSDQSVTIRTQGGQQIVMKDVGQTITIETGSGESIEISMTGITVKANSVTLDSRSIDLGSGGEPVLLGIKFLTLFNTHVHPTAVGPTGPPTPPILPVQVLSTNTRSA